MSAELFRAARAYIEQLDFRIVVADREKRPTHHFPHGATNATQNLEVIERALRETPDATIAARVGRERVVVDGDVRNGSLERLAKSLAWRPFPLTWVTETPTGGVHDWFRGVDYYCHGHVLGNVEVIRGNRLVTLPPSRRAGGQYRWVNHPLRTPLAELPQWFQDLARVPPEKEHDDSGCDDTPENREKRAAAYMEKFDGAIQGDNGAKRTMAAAVIVLRGFWLDDDAAFRVLSQWNHFCDPIWSDFDLNRKIREARRHGRMAWGEMLRKERAA